MFMGVTMRYFKVRQNLWGGLNLPHLIEIGLTYLKIYAHDVKDILDHVCI